MKPTDTEISYFNNEHILNPTSTLSTVSEKAKNAAEITSMTLDAVPSILQRSYTESLTQWNVSRYLESLMYAEGADAYLAFPTLVMSGPELREPHGNSLNDRTYIITPQSQKVVMIDIGCKFEGICTDITRTYFFDGVEEEVLAAYSAVLSAQEAAIAAIRDGQSIAGIDSIIRSHLSDYLQRDDVYIHRYWGHGVGRYVHEYPGLWGGSQDTLVSGQLLAIEPGLWFDDGSGTQWFHSLQ
jgi:Xaa-Pro aminopeptidase